MACEVIYLSVETGTIYVALQMFNHSGTQNSVWVIHSYWRHLITYVFDKSPVYITTKGLCFAIIIIKKMKKNGCSDKTKAAVLLWNPHRVSRGFIFVAKWCLDSQYPQPGYTIWVYPLYAFIIICFKKWKIVGCYITYLNNYNVEI
jgi:hypothetical protein